MNDEKIKYERYCYFCNEAEVKPLSFDGWKKLCNGEIPDELTVRRIENIRGEK